MAVPERRVICRARDRLNALAGEMETKTADGFG
jgi:hypothetical protein